MNQQQGRSGSAVAVPVSLPLSHPLLERYIPVAKSLTPAAEKTAAVMVEAAPFQGLDLDENQTYFSSLPMDRMLNRANERSIDAAKPAVEEAHGMAMNQIDVLDRAEASLIALENLEEEVVDADGVLLRRLDAPRLLDAAQAAAARAEASQDYEHRQTGKPGFKAWIVVLFISLFEAAGVYAFMVNLADYRSLLVFVALLGLLISINHLATEWAGHVLRSYLQLRRARTHAHTAAYAISRSSTQQPRRRSNESLITSN